MSYKTRINDEIDELLDKAIDTLDKREADLELPYWFMDEGETYCYDCMVALKPGGHFGEEYDGGGVCEEDSCCLCENCSKLLQYTLTDYGVTSELAHFVEAGESGFDWSDPNQCYELARVAHGIFENDDQWRDLLKVMANSQNLPEELTVLKAVVSNGL